MSIDVLTARFDAHEKVCIEKIDKLDVKVETKLGKTSFWAIFSFLVTILLGMFSYIAIRMDSFAESSSTVQSKVSSIEGKLTPYNIEFTK